MLHGKDEEAERTNLVSDSFSSVINAIVRVVIHIRGREKNVKFAILRILHA